MEPTRYHMVGITCLVPILKNNTTKSKKILINTLWLSKKDQMLLNQY